MNIMKSATDLSFVFLPPSHVSEQPEKKAISVQQGLFQRACGGAGDYVHACHT